MLQNFLDQYNSLLTIQYSDMTLIVNNLHSIPWITVGAYLLIVFQLPKLLVAANLKFSNLSGVMFLWNVLLSLMSLVMTICIGIPYYQRAVATGISYYVCDDHAVRWEASPEVFWTYFFVRKQVTILICIGFDKICRTCGYLVFDFEKSWTSSAILALVPSFHRFDLLLVRSLLQIQCWIYVHVDEFLYSYHYVLLLWFDRFGFQGTNIL